MKIAICLSGIDRCFDETSSFLVENVIKPLNADVFIHTWKSDSLTDRFIENKNNEKLYSRLAKKYEIENFNSDWNFLKCTKKANIVPMYYSIYKSFSLVPDDYDIIIRSRFDSLYINKFVLPKIIPNNVHIRLNGWNKNTYAPRNNFILEGYNLPFVADNFAIGDYNSMKEYSSVYLGLNSYIRTMIPECCLAEQLHYKNISYQWFDELKYMSLISIHNNVLTFESDYEEKQHIFINRGL